MMGMEIDSFLEYLQDVKRYSPHTLAAYAKDLNQFVEFCEKIELIGEWKEVTPKMVRRFEAGLMTGGLEFGEGEHARRPKAMTARAVCRKLSSIRSLFGYLMREGIVEDDPVELVLPPKIGKKLPVFVPTDEMDELLKKKFNPNDFSMLRDFMILEVAYCTGMRRAELVGLKVEDADMSGKVFRITGKGNKQRLVPMLEEMQGDMELYLKKREAIVNRRGRHSSFFITDAGAPANEQYIYRHVKKCLDHVHALSKRSTHVLRHSFATALLNNEANIEAIRKLLGHSSLAATQVYTHNSFENLKRVYNHAHPRA